MTSPNVALSGKPAALVALAQGRPVTEAAQAAGVTRRTVERWRTDPTFEDQVTRLRADMLSDAAGRLSAASTAAVDALVALLDDESGHVRARAATSLLQAVLAVRVWTDFERRLEAAEREHAAAREWLS